MFNDFLSTQPLEVLSKTDITDERIMLPVKVDPDEFYGTFKDNIDVTTFTTEKAIYIAAMHEKETFKKSKDLLNSRIKY